jgi:hypothetical protein
MGLIPVQVMPIELDIASFYETQDRQRKNSRDGKDIPLHVHSVYSVRPASTERADKSTSVDAIRIEPRNERIGIGEIKK